MAFKENRKMKVYYQYGHRDKLVPTIRLKGDWLREFGFEIGDEVNVECGEGFLMITRVADVLEE